MTGLQFQDISKSFPGVKALQNVSFDVFAGSVHALCGENGAGKSTLLKILSGAYRPDSGGLAIDGQSMVFKQPIDALKAGVAVIYQELHLAPELSVAENIFIGHLPSQVGVLRSGTLRAKAEALLAEVGIHIDPSVKVGTLPLAQRQMVEIGKALSRNAHVIAFDEPTSALSSREVDTLFEIIAKLKAQGRIILYVTHRMDEIFRTCDSATMLRDGRHVETFQTLEGRTPDDIVSRMVGRKIEDVWGYRARVQSTEKALEVSDLTGEGVSEPINLEVKKGEILGVFGLVGAGRSEMLRAVYRAAKKSRGHISIGGVPCSAMSPRGMIRGGLMLCPEDRKKEGIIGLRSVQENCNISARRNRSHLKFVINSRWENSNAESQVKNLGIKTPHLHQPIQLLSGGNQQKVILGRWLSEDVKVLMLDEPTRGIDVGAKREIYEILYNLAESGVGILFVSSELPEVLGVADRILVMRQGKIVADVPKSEATEASLLSLALPIANT